VPNYKQTRSKAAVRPKKPYDGFPLTPHPGGSWQKKIRGKIHYFGRWGRVVGGSMQRLPGDGWEEALELYKAQADDLHAGRIPRQIKAGEITVAGICNAFLTAKLRQMEAGEITARTFGEYRQTTDRLVSEFGGTRSVNDLAANDFELLRASLANQFGPVRLGNSIQRVRTVFKYGFEAALIDKPVRFGPQFKKPSASVMRRHRASSGKRLFTAEEILWLLDGKTIVENGKRTVLAGAGTQLRAMILLGINCGFGNSDVAQLQKSVVDLKKGWIEFPRPKTGIERLCPLWPETVKALKLAIAERPKHHSKDDADCVFITVHGNRWARIVVSQKQDATGESITKTTQINAVVLEFGKVLKRLGINGRKGLGFYSLRHTFRTIADGTKDFPAVRLIMGHVDGSIDAVYREDIDNSRLTDVTKHVRKWLFGAKGGGFWFDPRHGHLRPQRASGGNGRRHVS
jgi:integrase